MTAPSLVWPCDTHAVTCGFYCYPFHYADDLGAQFETCRAAATGVVVTADSNVTYCEREGRYVEIMHADGWVSRYFHLNRIDVRVGQFVFAGQQIGQTGASGWTVRNGVCIPYGPHLHWALHASSYAEARTVWASPQLVAGNRWAVSPVWAITHQEEVEMKSIVVKCTDGWHYAVRPDCTRVLIDGDPTDTPANRQAASARGAAFLVNTGLATSHPVPVDGADLYPVLSFEAIT